jgi:hypothetical protein
MLASAPMAGILLVAMFTVHLPYGFSSVKLLAVTTAGAQFGQPGYEVDLLYLGCLAALVLGGSGPFSVDGLLALKSRTGCPWHRKRLRRGRGHDELCTNWRPICPARSSSTATPDQTDRRVVIMKLHTHRHKSETHFAGGNAYVNGANISNIHRDTRAPCNSLRLFCRSNLRPRPYKSHLTTWPLRLAFAGREIPGGRPRHVAQTTDGYIWIGTNNGLFKFDGVRFVHRNAQSGWH